MDKRSFGKLDSKNAMAVNLASIVQVKQNTIQQNGWLRSAKWIFLTKKLPWDKYVIEASSIVTETDLILSRKPIPSDSQLILPSSIK